jgi:hypothetical protein
VRAGESRLRQPIEVTVAKPRNTFNPKVKWVQVQQQQQQWDSYELVLDNFIPRSEQTPARPTASSLAIATLTHLHPLLGPTFLVRLIELLYIDLAAKT